MAAADAHRTWILTGSPENYAATREHGYRVIGLKERNRNRALEIEPGDRIVLYLTRTMAFAASIRVDRRAVRGPREDLARQARKGGFVPVALRDRAGARAAQ